MLELLLMWTYSQFRSHFSTNNQLLFLYQGLILKLWTCFWTFPQMSKMESWLITFARSCDYSGHTWIFKFGFRPWSYCFNTQTRSQSNFLFLLERDCLCMGNMRIVLCIGVAKLMGPMWEKCYFYRLISMFHLIPLENKSFEFFGQGLKNWCCTFRWFFWTIFYFVRWVGLLMGRNCEKVLLIFIFRRSSN